MNTDTTSERYLTRPELPEFLQAHGYPISRSTISKRCRPVARGRRPKAHGAGDISIAQAACSNGESPIEANN
jgi:hypothetical protein